ncbi:MAG: hypothetical protein IJ188_05950 [Clostridia bacterium]|nr:hypothetical protein [Clostridia bacterium]MBQ9252158.1 hypothetical protein [Clostridia bacterium]
MRKIRVPFCPESLLSGIHEVSSPGTPLFYFRSFSVPEAWEGRRILLHFGAVDQECDVKINGRDAGHFISGYLPFQLDITEYLVSGENLLEVIAVDPLDYARPWGKQKTDRGGMWYTPVSGIWQSVWIEPVPEKHIQDLAIDTDLTSVTIRLVGAETGTVRFQEAEYTIAKKQNQQSAEK